MSSKAVALAVLAFAWGMSMPGRAQPSPPAPPPTTGQAPTPEDVTRILDQALLDVRLAERRGEGAQEAFDRARQQIETVRQQDPRNGRALFYQGRLEVLADKPDLAVNKLREWVNSREGANDWEGHFILGSVYFDTQFYKLAKPILEKAIELNPREAKIYALLSRCEAKLFDRKAAVRRAQQAIELFGTDADADTYLLLAQALLLGEQLNDADRAARAARELAVARLRRDGANVDTLTKADACIDLLLQITQKKVQLDASDPDLYLDVAHLIQEKAEVSTLLSAHTAAQWALRGLQQTQERPPEDLILEATRLLVRIGRTTDARKIAQTGRQVYPDSLKIKELYDRLTPTETPPTPNAGESPVSPAAPPPNATEDAPAVSPQ